MQTAPTRANRIPRIHSSAIPRRPSLCRRLQRWFWAMRLAWINSDIRELQHWMLLDQSTAAAHRLSLTDSPALRTRLLNQRAQLGNLITAQGRATLALVELECEL